jgi:hypothetical protein
VSGQSRERPPEQQRHEPDTPARFCRALLDAMEASEGRRRRRARDTTADAIGMQIKRELLEAAVRDEPSADDFEAWLVQRCIDAGVSDGPVRAMALSIWDEWRLAGQAAAFRDWLAQGAPSDDREPSRSRAGRGEGEG